ncbi:MAG: type II secretion system protein GspG [Planctomycetota bacterium]
MQQATEQHQSNGLGIAGFVVSLVGLLSCGLIAPIGAIMSAIALNKQPKGFAIAGLIIGIFGSLWIVVLFMFLGGLGGLLAIAGIAAGQHLEVLGETTDLAPIVETYRTANSGQLPPDITSLPGYLQQDEWLDPWGNPYRVEPDGEGFMFMSSGEDGVAGTMDDVEGYSSIGSGELQQFFDELESEGEGGR